jgi:hypothetical protein
MSAATEKKPHIAEDANILEGAHTFYPIGPKLILVTISLMLAVFCVALDNTVRLKPP